MAERLARIFGTEEDKVNCPFYFKIGSCRHGDKCTRLHNKPPISQTLLIPHMYENPPAAIAMAGGTKLPEEAVKELQNQFEEFYEEVFFELAKYGEVEDIIVCDNIELIGNVYVKYTTEEGAENCIKGLTGRYYAGKMIVPEYSPVTDFREARCRQYDEGECKSKQQQQQTPQRGGYCNFMHLKHVPRSFKSSLFRDMYKEYPEYERRGGRRDDDRKRKSKSRSRSRDKKKRRSSRSQDRASKSRSHSKPNKYKHPSKSKSGSGSSISLKFNSLSPKLQNLEPKRQTSEERRAMIESWNQEEDAKRQGQ